MSRRLKAHPTAWVSLPNQWSQCDMPTDDQIEAALLCLAQVNNLHPDDGLAFMAERSDIETGVILTDANGGSWAEDAPEHRVLGAFLEYVRRCRAGQEADAVTRRARASAKAGTLTLIQGGRR